MKQIDLRTTARTQLVNITSKVADALAEFDPSARCCHVFVPHTTAAVVINEAADPDVAQDLATAYCAMVPKIFLRPRRGQLRFPPVGDPPWQLGEHSRRQWAPRARHMAGHLLCRSRRTEKPAGMGERVLSRSRNTDIVEQQKLFSTGYLLTWLYGQIFNTNKTRYLTLDSALSSPQQSLRGRSKKCHF